MTDYLEEGDEANSSRVTHDARQLFYRLWAQHIAHIRTAIINGDYDVWNSMLYGLFNQVFAFLDEEEIALVEKAFGDLDKARVDLENVPHGRESQIKGLRLKRRMDYEKKLHAVEREILKGMKNKGMLLPYSSGDLALSTDDILRRMGVSK